MLLTIGCSFFGSILDDESDFETVKNGGVFESDFWEDGLLFEVEIVIALPIEGFAADAVEVTDVW